MKLIFNCSALLLLVAVAAAADEPRTFQGEIADSQCALNVHSLTRSHREMLKSKSMGGTSSSCTLYCIKYLGGDLVLVNGDQVYRLENLLDEVRNFAGQKVKISGSLDAKTNTIRVGAIQSLEKPPQENHR